MVILNYKNSQNNGRSKAPNLNCGIKQLKRIDDNKISKS
jgi:hypothetical protein